MTSDQPFAGSVLLQTCRQPFCRSSTLRLEIIPKSFALRKSWVFPIKMRSLTRISLYIAFPRFELLKEFLLADEMPLGQILTLVSCTEESQTHDTAPMQNVW